MAPFTARLALAAWRNDDVFEVPIRVRGLDLSAIALAMQIRLAPDTPGAPLVSLAKVTNGNAEGLRVAGVTAVDGVPVTDLRIRINKTTLAGLPYSGELGDATTLAYALLINGRTRLEGPFSILAHAYGSDAAPTNRPVGLSLAKYAAPSGGATLTISADGGVTVAIDGADLVSALVDTARSQAASATTAAAAADADRVAAEAARDAAILAGRVFPTSAAGVAASVDGQYFVVPGIGATALRLYRREAGAGVVKVEFPSVAGISVYGTVPAIVRDTAQDQAAAINAAFLGSDVREIIVPDGVYSIGRTIEVPAGKRLTLKPSSVLRALPSFAIIDGKNHGVLLMGDRAEVSGGTVDMNKRGIGEGINSRYNGVTVLDGARDCIRRDMRVGNCTGYAVYDSGAQGGNQPPSSYNENLRTFNSEIHYEPQAADGSRYVFCGASDGDGDIACAAWFHPLVGARNITFDRPFGRGHAGTAFDITPNVYDLDNIIILDADVEILGGGTALSTTAGYESVTNLFVRGGRFVSLDGFGATLSKTSGRMSDATFIGRYLGLGQTLGDMDYADCVAEARGKGEPQAVFGWTVQGGGQGRWRDGTLMFSGRGDGSGPHQGGLVTGNTRSVPPVSAVPFIIRQADGTSEIVQQSPTTAYSDLLALPFVPGPRQKIWLSLSVERIAGTGASGLAGAVLTWVVLPEGYIRVWLEGADFGTSYVLHWHYTERE